jgi:hypothetical protein
MRPTSTLSMLEWLNSRRCHEHCGDASHRDVNMKTMDEQLSMVVDAALLVNVAVGIADGEWTRKEANAIRGAFERIVATSRSHMIRDALMYYHDRENDWLQLSCSPQVIHTAMGELTSAARAKDGTPEKARKFYKPVAKAVGTMLSKHLPAEQMRVVGLVWYVGLATASADGPFFGEKVSDEERAVIDSCASDLAIAAGTNLRECLEFINTRKG